ncbi:MAG: DUF3737 family protein [Clostridia bacterium]|nr:DUF3737 family protein [Clostridia bacterium]
MTNIPSYFQTISGQTYGQERALYNLTEAAVIDCTFAGEEDGESALKESRQVIVRGCTFALRYPLWHSEMLILENSTMTETCRAPLWYVKDGVLLDADIHGVKCLRECDTIRMERVQAVSPEFGWRCRKLESADCEIESEYAFFESADLDFSNLRLKGKYSFQYVRNLHIADSNLDTKDSFWHAENVRVENSTVRGEYLGWYSDGLTLVNCKIIGTQPFCYCKNLTLIDCELVDCDLAFEYSEVQADVRGHIVSVKNPRSGRICADSIGEIIRGGAVYPCQCDIVVRGEA